LPRLVKPRSIAPAIVVLVQTPLDPLRFACVALSRLPVQQSFSGAIRVLLGGS
jgi:hypothetical protein